MTVEIYILCSEYINFKLGIREYICVGQNNNYYYLRTG